MQFRLTYDGPLYSGQASRAKHVHEIRRHIRVQMRELWNQKPLSNKGYQSWRTSPPDTGREGDYFLQEQRGSVPFVPLVSERNHLLARLDILLLRPAPPGDLINHGGDLDNRLKTFLDALRIPTATELPPGYVPSPDEQPFDCLLSDDKLVTAISIECDRLLRPGAGVNDVSIIAKVTVGAIYVTLGNSGLVSMGLAG